MILYFKWEIASDVFSLLNIHNERYLILGDYVISKNVDTVTQNYFVNINMCFKFPNNLHYYADDKINN